MTVVLATGCGADLHPGAAAVVDDTSIQQSTVDSMVSAACGYVKAQRLAGGGAAPNQSVATLRNSIANSYITFAVDDMAARKLHIRVSEAAIARFPTTIPNGVSAADRATLQQFFHQSTRSQLQEAAIGLHLTNPSVTTADKVTSQNIRSYLGKANSYLTRFRANQQVVVNPTYGRWSGASLQPDSGSLSDAVSASAKKWLTLRAPGSSTTDLPLSQVCG